MTEWIRGTNIVTKDIANVSKSMLNSLPLLNNWLVSKTRNDQHIKVEHDPLVGSSSFFKLSNGLVNFRHEKGILFLAQVSSMNGIDELMKLEK